MARGTLRIYLGAAAGVGKTFAMLNEGRRRRDYGEDVVVAFVETHGRQKTAAQVGDLEVVPRRKLDYRDGTFEELDVDAVLARKPQIALVDELAHTNVPGSRNEKRWEDVEELLEAGINVISTMNVQHLESLNDVVEQITGVKQRETIPDAVVRRADEIQLVDLTPLALRNRLARGDVYPPERIDTALANYFRPGNLTALRELALAWLGDRVDEALAEYRERHGIAEPWETRERVLVALTGSRRRRAPHPSSRSDRAAVEGRPRRRPRHPAGRPRGPLRRPARATARAPRGARRHVPRSRRGRRRRRAPGRSALAERDADRDGREPPFSLAADHARLGDRASDPRVGRGHRRSRREPPRRPLGGGVRRATHPSPDDAPPQARRARLRARRSWASAPDLDPRACCETTIGLPTVMLLFLLLVVAVSAVGGLWPALTAAISGSLLVNWYFVPPLYTFTIS